jgi:hypothetical protein
MSTTETDMHLPSIRFVTAMVAIAVLLLSAPSSKLRASDPPSFRYDVLPTLTRAGCNAGTCHGTPVGKNGFRLSLRGFDPQLDLATLTREADGRRIDRMQPENSLLLQKAIAEVPHQGGRRLAKDEAGYRILRDWIAAGAPDDPEARPSLERLTIDPPQTIVDAPQDRAEFRVTAHFAGGLTDDVTDRCRFSVTDDQVAELPSAGTVRKRRRGEVTVSAEYSGNMAAATVLFREPVAEFSWPDPTPNNKIDELIFSRLQYLQIEPAPPADDATFVRRVYLDTQGRLPTPEEVRAFLSDESPHKRSRLIDDLLDRPAFAEWWAMKWTDRLGCNQRYVGKWGAIKYHAWIRNQMAVNTPHDEFVRAILTASGPNYSHPPAGFWRRMRVGGIAAMDPLLAAEEISQLFLGVRIQCARCHNHPGENWTQDDYYGLAAFFPRVKFQAGPYVNHQYDKEDTVFADNKGEVTHGRTGAVAAPTFLGGQSPTIDPQEDRRVAFAQWLTAPGNPFFARAAVNRIWYHLLGRGIVEPVDDFRASNPPSHPELLEWLTEEFVRSRFDRKHIIRLILNSQTYQLGFERTPTATDDARYFAYCRPRLLGAEQLLDAISQACGVPESFPGLPVGTRAVDLPDGEYKHPFLEAFGRPARALACECERESTTNISQALQLVGGDILHNKLRHDAGRAAQLAASSASAEEIIEELYLATLSRFPNDDERELLIPFLQAKQSDRRQAVEDLLWNLLNHREFLLQH